MSWLYPFCALCAIVLGMWIAERRFQPAAAARHAYMAAIWTGLAGARLWSIMVDEGRWTLVGGLSLWGALVGASVGAIAYLLARGQGLGGLLRFADAVAPAIALAGGIVRLGCFSVGCCFGVPSSLPWAVEYGPGTPAYIWQSATGIISPGSPHSVPVHPTQLYESLAWFLAAGFLLTRRAGGGPPGSLFLSVTVCYAVVRFALDFIRPRLVPSPVPLLSLSQLAAVVFGLTALALLVFRRSTHEHDLSRT